MLSRLAFNISRMPSAQWLGRTLKQAAAKLRRRRGVGSVEPQHPIDTLYGTDTGGWVSPSKLKTQSPSDIYNRGYLGSQPSIIRASLAHLPSLQGAAFVDLGCGKGRALMVASEYPFRRIIGVELSLPLCEIGRANAVRIAAVHPSRTAIEIVQKDALLFELPPGFLVIFIYNSFFPALMKAIVSKIAIHAAHPGNKLFIVYYNPTCAQAFDADPTLLRYFAGRLPSEDAESAAVGWAGDNVVIWQAGEPMFKACPGASAEVRVTNGGAVGEVVVAPIV